MYKQLYIRTMYAGFRTGNFLIIPFFGFVCGGVCHRLYAWKVGACRAGKFLQKKTPQIRRDGGLE